MTFSVVFLVDYFLSLLSAMFLAVIFIQIYVSNRLDPRREQRGGISAHVEHREEACAVPEWMEVVEFERMEPTSSRADLGLVIGQGKVSYHTPNVGRALMAIYQDECRVDVPEKATFEPQDDPVCHTNCIFLGGDWFSCRKQREETCAVPEWMEVLELERMELTSSRTDLGLVFSQMKVSFRTPHVTMTALTVIYQDDSRFDVQRRVMRLKPLNHPRCHTNSTFLGTDRFSCRKDLQDVLPMEEEDEDGMKTT